jgi:tetrahydromethanopterin S-methyltransferase subunit G
VTDPPDVEARLTALEARVEEVAADAAAARHLAAARDRDLADLGVKVDANRAAINALGVRTASRFDGVEGRLDRVEGRLDRVEGRLDRVETRLGAVENEVRTGFAEMRARFDQTAAGHQRIVDLITGLMEQRGEAP